MQQNFRQCLTEFHSLFDGGRCIGWQLEELVARAIKSDTSAHHHAIWKEGGHDIEAGIRLRTNGEEHDLQIKSGRILKRKAFLKLSGYRLGRFEGDLVKISKFLNEDRANFVAIPYEQVNDDEGRKHIYRICYIANKYLRGVSEDGWKQKGKQWIQKNDYEVEFSLSPSMNWQIWWSIPLDLVGQTEAISIG